MRKPQKGDVYEINTPAGLAYVQYTHDSKTMGQLVRVLPGLFASRPENLNSLAQQREMYFIFYTLEYALRESLVELVYAGTVPEWAVPPPIMRRPTGLEDENGKVLSWRIGDISIPQTLEGFKRMPVVRDLTREQERLSMYQLWPHPAMVEHLARGWTPERAEELRLQDVAEGEKRKSKSAAQTASEREMSHYLYFPKERNAERAGERLRELGFRVHIRKGADGKNWLALAAKIPPESGEQMDELRQQMETLATTFDGEYDGWETPVDSLGNFNVQPRRKVN